MNIKDSKILVIGGAGFIGSHLVEQLLEEDPTEIVVYDNFSRGTIDNLESALQDQRVSIFNAGGDICQADILKEAMQGKDAVFHLAALWLLQCHEFPRAAFDVNIRGTFNVVECCRDCGVKKLISSSSASVYGDAVEIPMAENHPFNNRTFYGATKIAGEQMCRAFYERYGLNYVGLRYMNVYGPRQDYRGAYVAVMMKILDRIDQGLPPVVYGDGSQAYDFVFVRDVARANILALKAGISDAFFNVGTGERTSIRELAELLLRLTGSKLEVEYLPGGTTFVTNRVGSIENSRKDLDFTAITPLEDGMKELISWRTAHKAEVEKRRNAVEKA